MMNSVSELILGLYGPDGGMHARLLACLFTSDHSANGS